MGTSTRASNELNVAGVGRTTVFADHNESVCEADDQGGGYPTDPSYTLNGWRIYRGDTDIYTGKLFPESYIGPNGEVVHVLNSSQYAAVGENDWVVFGPNAEHVQAFLRACGFEDIEVEPTAIVMQTT